MDSTPGRQVVSEAYHSPLFFALALQIPIALLCLLMLDGGQTAKVCGVAMAAHWLGVTLILHRRPLAPTVADLTFLRWAFPLIFAITLVAQELLK